MSLMASLNRWHIVEKSMQTFVLDTELSLVIFKKIKIKMLDNYCRNDLSFPVLKSMFSWKSGQWWANLIKCPCTV